MASLPTNKISSFKSRLTEASKNTSPVQETASNELVDQLAVTMARAFQSTPLFTGFHADKSSINLYSLSSVPKEVLNPVCNHFIDSDNV